MSYFILYFCLLKLFDLATEHYIAWNKTAFKPCALRDWYVSITYKRSGESRKASAQSWIRARILSWTTCGGLLWKAYNNHKGLSTYFEVHHLGQTPPPLPPSLTFTWKFEQITFLKLPHKGIQTQNVTATNSKRFKLRTFKKVLFIIVTFNIHGRISVLGLWETETYSFCTELCYHYILMATWSLLLKIFSVFFLHVYWMNHFASFCPKCPTQMSKN